MDKAETFRQWQDRRIREAAASSGATLQACREMVEGQNDRQSYYLELAGFLMGGGTVTYRTLDALPAREVEFFRGHMVPLGALDWYIPKAIRTGDGWGK